MKWEATVLAAVATAALIAARVMSIARFDVNTASMILQVSGTGTALAGTALTLLTPAVAVGTVFVAVVVFVDPTLLRTELPNEWVLGLAIAATVCLTPRSLAIGTLSFVLLVAISGWLLRRGGRTVSVKALLLESLLLRAMFAVLVVVVAVTPIISQRPWLPLQEITLVNGDPVVGYVLGEAEGQVVVMSDKDRTIQLLDPDEIKGREICQGGNEPGGALAGAPQANLSGSLLGSLLWGADTPSYAACPQVD